MHSTRSNEYVYVRRETGQVMTGEHRNSVMHLIKLLFLLDVINEEQAVKIALQFDILSV